MRPFFGVVVVLIVNSVVSTPILRSTHSIASTFPVERAVSGMSPSACVRGIRRMPAGSVVLVVFTVFIPHEVLTFTVNWRRQRPSWMTIGMLVPTGTFVSVNVPSNAVVVSTRGEPLTSAPHVEHCWACDSVDLAAKGVTVPFGTYTSTFGTGSPLATVLGRYVEVVPATTVPVSDVVPPPSHGTCCLQ